MTALNIGARIRAHRRARNMAQEDLAASCMCSRQTVSNWETNKTLPDVHSLKHLAITFDTTIDDLLSDEDPERVDASSRDRRAGASTVRVLIMFLAVLAVPSAGRAHAYRAVATYAHVSPASRWPSPRL